MNRKLKWGTALALALATVAAPAFADSDRRGRGHGNGHGYSDARHGHRHDHRDHRRDHRRDDRRHAYRDHRPARHGPAVHYYHPAPPPRWTRGSYVRHYRQPVYVVHDYYGHGLRHPPHGYRWMRDDYGDFLLVAIATGLIADLVLR